MNLSKISMRDRFLEKGNTGTVEEKETEKRRNYILCLVLMKCRSNSPMKAAVIAQTVLLCDNHT